MAFGSTLAGVFGGSGGGSLVGGAVVRLMLDAAQFDAGLNSSQAKLVGAARMLDRTAGGFNRVGGAMTRGVTLPIVAAGAASVKMALDFEGAFTKIRANSNLTDKEIDVLRKRIMSLAGETGKAPIELAEGLYFLASAGLTAAQVGETLEMSAKASAAGFGEVADIARLTANALKAYARDGLTAKEVTDTLAAAVREGTAEPVEFSNALGKILPIASKAKVGFDEVTASLASLSNIGLDVNEGVTAMRGLLQSLSTGGPQAVGALKDIGLTFQDLRDSLAKDGLLATMRLLEDRTDGNIDKLRKIVPNIRAMTGLFGITGQKAKDVDASFRAVIGATDDLDKAFKKTTEDPGFKLRQLMAELQTLAIELGTDALPLVKDLAEGASDLIGQFRDLPKPVQENIIKWGLLAAAMGPVLRIMGGLLGTSARFIALSARLGSALARTAAAGAASQTVAGAGAAGSGAAVAGARGAALKGGAVGVAAVGIIAGLAKAAADQAKANREWDTAAEVLKRYAFSVEDLEAAYETLRSGGGIDDLPESLRDVAREAGLSADEIRRVLAGGKGAFGAFEDGVRNLVDAHWDWIYSQTQSMDAARAFHGLIEGAAPLTRRQARTLASLTDAVYEYGGGLDDVQRRTINNLLKVGDFKGALDLLRDALKKNSRELAGGRENLGRWGGSADIQRAKAKLLEERVRGIGAAMDSLNGKRVDATINLHAHLLGLTKPPGGQVTGRAGGGSVTAGTPYIVGEAGMELFVPSASGTIVPHHRLARGSRGGGDLTVIVHQNGIAPDSYAEDIVDSVFEAIHGTTLDST